MTIDYATFRKYHDFLCNILEGLVMADYVGLDDDEDAYDLNDDELCFFLECFKDPNNAQYKPLFEGLDFNDKKNMESNLIQMLKKIRAKGMAAGAKERHPDFQKIFDLFCSHEYDKDPYTGMYTSSKAIRYWFTKF